MKTEEEMEEEIALKTIQDALEKWTLRRRTLTDANGRAFPDGEKTKLLPSGTDGVALEVTLEENGEIASTRTHKETHELRICKLDTAILRAKTGMTGEQLMAMIALMATFDVIVLVNTPPGEDLQAAATMKNLLSHHSGDSFDLVLLPMSNVFLRLPLAVLKATESVLFYDGRFKVQEKIKCLSVYGDDIAVSDGEDPADKESLDVHDGWLSVPRSRTVEVQRVGLELQIVEEEGGEKEGGKTDNAKKNSAELFCAKLIDR